MRDMCDRLARRESRRRARRRCGVTSEITAAKCQSAPRVFTSCLGHGEAREQKEQGGLPSRRHSRARVVQREARRVPSVVGRWRRSSPHSRARRCAGRDAPRRGSRAPLHIPDRPPPRLFPRPPRRMRESASSSPLPPGSFGAAIARPWAEALVELSQPSATDATLDLATGTGTCAFAVADAVEEAKRWGRTPRRRRASRGPEGLVASVLGLDKDRHALKRANEALLEENESFFFFVHFSRSRRLRVGGRVPRRRAVARREEALVRARVGRARFEPFRRSRDGVPTRSREPRARWRVRGLRVGASGKKPNLCSTPRTSRSSRRST